MSLDELATKDQLAQQTKTAVMLTETQKQLIRVWLRGDLEVGVLTDRGLVIFKELVKLFGVED